MKVKLAALFSLERRLLELEGLGIFSDRAHLRLVESLFGDRGDLDPDFKLNALDRRQVLDDLAGDLAEVACTEVGFSFTVPKYRVCSGLRGGGTGAVKIASAPAQSSPDAAAWTTPGRAAQPVT